jgi:hypothetical protein
MVKVKEVKENLSHSEKQAKWLLNIGYVSAGKCKEISFTSFTSFTRHHKRRAIE